LEIAATACSLAGGVGTAAITSNGAVIAYAATWAENVGFYGCALVREARRNLGTAPLSFASVKPALLPSARSLVAEFGPAEVFDSFVLRPACMYLLPKLTGHLAVGLLLGKVLADGAFFGIAIIAFEWNRYRK
jgi:hypothetical protein